MASADVLVIGGGIIGLAAAFEMAEAGGRRIQILERHQVGSGATSKATGGVRTQFSSRMNVVLAQASRDHFLRWSQIYGGDPHFSQVGYLFFTASNARAQSLAAAAREQRAWGVSVDVVQPDDIRRLVPGSVVDDLRLGTYTPEDGLADPGAAIVSLEAACRRRGVAIREGTAAEKLLFSESGTVAGVRLTDGTTFGAEVVVVATGPWTSQLLDPVGVSLPIEPHHRQVYRTAPLEGWPSRIPLSVDLDSGIYCHSDGEGVVFGGGDRATAAGYDEVALLENVTQIAGRLMERWPLLQHAKITHTWAGLREMTPDDHGIVGVVAGHPGLYVAAGFSGHGFMQAPAVGQIVAALVEGRTPFVNPAPLSPERFNHKVKGEQYVF